MINFFKDYSYYMFKMVVNQIGMTFFGLVLSMATSGNDNLFLISSIFGIVFYMFLLYTMTWEIGYEEKIRIDGGRLAYKPMKGFFVSLCANLLNLGLGIAITVSYYLANGYITTQTGAVVPDSPELVVNIFGVCKTVATLIQGMYSGLINTLFLNSPWIYIVIVLPSLITCTLAYIMGVKGKSFIKILAPKQNKE